MDNIIFAGPGGPALDTLIQEIFQRRHPKENCFPRGSRVLVTIPLPTLASRLSMENKIPLSQANGLARYLRESPSEVLGIEDLTDKTGVVRSYASVMTDEGYMYLFELENLCLV